MGVAEKDLQSTTLAEREEEPSQLN